MTTEHAPNPPEDKFKRWEDDILNERENVDVVLDCTWKDGYRAGADAELEACCEWCADGSMVLAQELRAARRPKPPSLARQGCDALDTYIYGNPNHKDKERTYNTIRAALQRLQELEKGNE